MIDMANFSTNEQMQVHVFTYRHAGGEWLLEINATDADDARVRLGKLAYATHHGVRVAKLPTISTPIGILSVWARNTAFRLLPRFLKQR